MLVWLFVRVEALNFARSPIAQRAWRAEEMTCAGKASSIFGELRSARCCECSRVTSSLLPSRPFAGDTCAAALSFHQRTLIRCVHLDERLFCNQTQPARCPIALPYESRRAETDLSAPVNRNCSTPACARSTASFLHTCRLSWYVQQGVTWRATVCYPCSQSPWFETSTLFFFCFDKSSLFCLLACLLPSCDIVSLLTRSWKMIQRSLTTYSFNHNQRRPTYAATVFPAIPALYAFDTHGDHYTKYIRPCFVSHFVPDLENMFFLAVAFLTWFRIPLVSKRGALCSRAIGRSSVHLPNLVALLYVARSSWQFIGRPQSVDRLATTTPVCLFICNDIALCLFCLFATTRPNRFHIGFGWVG